MPLTPQEKRWVKRLQKVLNECPTSRIGFYTTGDCCLFLYDIGAVEDEGALRDFCLIVSDADAELGDVVFPNLVHSTAG